MPKIEMQQLLDNTVVSNQDLPPASNNKFQFNFAVPTGTDPAGTYKVIATADIPGVKDPSADQDLKVISPNSAGANPGLFGGLFKGAPKEDEIFARFPLWVVPTYPGDESFDGPYFREFLAGAPPLLRASLSEIFTAA